VKHNSHPKKLIKERYYRVYSMAQKFFVGVIRLLHIFPCLNMISVMLSCRADNFLHDPQT
jgi:hypothetical protein